jgi:hypothetical protein
MSETTFSLHSYRGPAHINGVDFTNVHASEHADSEGIVINKGWDGTATTRVRHSDSTITPDWLEAPGPVPVRIPDIGTGLAFLTGAALTNDDGLKYWEIEFTGSGPSPWAEDA